MFYSTLAVKREATPEEIRVAYRRLALEHHPDKNGGATSEKFLAIQKAYEALSDPDRRAEYDEMLKRERVKRRGFVRPAAYESSQLRRPFSYKLADDMNYQFESSPTYVRCGLRSGDIICFDIGVDGGTGCFIGLASDNYLYWCKDGTDYAQRLCHKDSNMALSNVKVLQRANLDAKRPVRMPPSSKLNSGGDGGGDGQRKTPRPAGSMTSRERESDKLFKQLRQKEAAKIVNERLTSTVAEEKSDREFLDVEYMRQLDHLHGIIALASRSLRYGVPLDRSAWEYLGYSTPPRAPSRSGGNTLPLTPSAERPPTLSEFPTPGTSLVMDSERCRTPPETLEEALQPAAAERRAGAGHPPPQHSATEEAKSASKDASAIAMARAKLHDSSPNVDDDDDDVDEINSLGGGTQRTASNTSSPRVERDGKSVTAPKAPVVTAPAAGKPVPSSTDAAPRPAKAGRPVMRLIRKKAPAPVPGGKAAKSAPQRSAAFRGGGPPPVSKIRRSSTVGRPSLSSGGTAGRASKAESVTGAKIARQPGNTTSAAAPAAQCGDQPGASLEATISTTLEAGSSTPSGKGTGRRSGSAAPGRSRTVASSPEKVARTASVPDPSLADPSLPPTAPPLQGPTRVVSSPGGKPLTPPTGRARAQMVLSPDQVTSLTQSASVEKGALYPTGQDEGSSGGGSGPSVPVLQAPAPAAGAAPRYGSHNASEHADSTPISARILESNADSATTRTAEQEDTSLSARQISMSAPPPPTHSTAPPTASKMTVTNTAAPPSIATAPLSAHQRGEAPPTASANTAALHANPAAPSLCRSEHVQEGCAVATPPSSKEIGDSRAVLPSSAPQDPTTDTRSPTRAHHDAALLGSPALPTITVTENANQGTPDEGLSPTTTPGGKLRACGKTPRYLEPTRSTMQRTIARSTDGNLGGTPASAPLSTFSPLEPGTSGGFAAVDADGAQAQASVTPPPPSAIEPATNLTGSGGGSLNAKAHRYDGMTADEMLAEEQEFMNAFGKKPKKHK